MVVANNKEKPRVLLFNLPPLGGDLFPVSLGYIAASLKKHRIDSTIWEIEADTDTTEADICEFIFRYRPTVVALAMYQINSRMAVRLAKLIKSFDPAILVAVGGPQATFMPAATLNEMPGVDVIVRGEGETVMPELVVAQLFGQGLAKVKGIAYRDTGGIRETAPRPLVRDLDRFASPYQMGIYRWRDHTGAAMLTSRGCTYRCSFCYTPNAFGRRVRSHSVARVLADIESCVKHGIKRFFFADPAFTFDKKRVTAIMRGIVRRRFKIGIWCETRADLVDAKLLALMAKAGVKAIAYGLESADPKVNARINKRVDLAQFTEAIRQTQAAGIDAEVFTLYGLPGQSRSSALETLRFVQTLGVKITGNSAGQQLHLFFGTDVLNAPKRFGIQVRDKRRPAYLSVGTDFETAWMTKRDIAYLARKYEQAGATSTTPQG